jgi:hypothetical protein
MYESTVLIFAVMLGAAIGSAGSLAFADESKNGDPKSESIQAQVNDTETAQQRASSEKAGQRHSEVSSAGDEGTVNENQDPSVSDRTPHDRLKEMEEGK